MAPLYIETDLNSRISRLEESVTPSLRVTVAAMSLDSFRGAVEMNQGILELEMLWSMESDRQSNNWSETQNHVQM
jgi:glycine cleavage system regulatory protein